MAVHLQLAPMQALTDIPFMNSYHEVFGGFDEMMAPYILASSNSPAKLNNLQKLFAPLHPEINLVPQLLSNDSEGFVHFANLLFDLGMKKVNWNLGCPFENVTKKQRGSGLLPYPDKIEAILDDMIPRLKPELSVKVRLGLESADEILPLIKIFNQHAIGELIIHPRTASQKYEGKADLNRFKELAPLIQVPLIYNGDIVNKAQFIELTSAIPSLNGVMIGRGAFINPFITNQIKGIYRSDDEKILKYKELYFKLHHHFKERTRSEDGFLHRMKEMWFYFSQTFEQGNSYLSTLRTINKIDLFENTVRSIFENGKLMY